MIELLKAIKESSGISQLCELKKGYLDEAYNIYDYDTDLIDTEVNEVIDCKKAGILYYQAFLEDSCIDYMRETLGLEGSIVKMTPEDYYRCCANIMRSTVEELKAQRARNIITIFKLKRVLLIHKRKLCLPMINWAIPSQEGLHRMYVIGELYGWDVKVPVLQVRKIIK